MNKSILATLIATFILMALVASFWGFGIAAVLLWAGVTETFNWWVAGIVPVVILSIGLLVGYLNASWLK